jgi:hypothetical protein
MFKKVNKLEYLWLGMVESYMGDEGATALVNVMVDNLKNLKEAYLDFGFNDIKGWGVP